MFIEILYVVTFVSLGNKDQIFTARRFLQPQFQFKAQMKLEASLSFTKDTKRGAFLYSNALCWSSTLKHKDICETLYNVQGAPKKMHHSDLYPISVLEVGFYFFTCVL